MLENLADGKYYTAFVRAVRGSYKTPEKIIQITTVSNVINPPTLKSSVVFEGTIMLEWDAQLPADFSHFKIVRKLGSEERIYHLTANNFTDVGVPNGKLISYLISLVNKSGGQSQPLNIQVKTFPEKPKVSYKYENGRFSFVFENQNDYDVDFRVDRNGQEVYRGREKNFVDDVKADGSDYIYKVYAVSQGMQSKPVELLVTAYAPLTAPKVNVSQSEDLIVISILRPETKDYKESVLEINGVIYKTELFSVKNEPDKVYKVKAYWVNKAGDNSAVSELIIETFPRQPIVDYKLDGNQVILKISDPSKVLKAEKFVILYGANKFETTSNEISISIDTTKVLHEFRVFSIYKEKTSPQTTIVVVAK
ncbi:MAG: hypothetical protein ABDH59_02820 [Fervidobacterium sp.]